LSTSVVKGVNKSLYRSLLQILFRPNSLARVRVPLIPDPDPLVPKCDPSVPTSDPSFPRSTGLSTPYNTGARNALAVVSAVDAKPPFETWALDGRNPAQNAISALPTPEMSLKTALADPLYLHRAPARALPMPVASHGQGSQLFPEGGSPRSKDSCSALRAGPNPAYQATLADGHILE
jgi:hypothetical protein